MITSKTTKKRKKTTSGILFVSLLKRIKIRKVSRIKLTKQYLIIVCIALFILGILGWIVSQKPLTIAQVECKVEDRRCEEMGIKVPERLFSYSLLSLDKESISQEMLLTYPNLLQVKVTTALPGKVTILLQARIPIALLEDKQGYRYLVDENGKVFAIGSAEVLPLIKTEEAVAVGEVVTSPSLTAALNLLSTLHQSLTSVMSITVHSFENLEVRLNSGEVALFSAERDITKQVDALQFILQNSTISEDIEHIDLRFDNPVVKSN